MEEMITNILGSAAIANIVPQWTWFQRLIDKLKKPFLIKLFSCEMCLGFWVGLISTQDIFMACITSVLAVLINRIF